MSDEVKLKIIEALAAIAVVAVQLWMLEPHPPYLAMFWRWVMQRCYQLGDLLWRTGLYAQAEYYRTV